MQRRKWLLGIYGGAFFVLLGVNSANAQTKDDELAALREEVEALRQVVNDLVALQAEQSVPVDKVVSSGVRDTQLGQTNPDQSLMDKSAVSPDDTKERVPLEQLRQPLGRFPDDAFVTSGQFGHSIGIPETNAAFRIGGAIQISANFDPDSLGFQQIGTQPTIPLDGSQDDGAEQTAIHIRHSRVNFDYRAPTEIGEFRTFVEFDFFGDGNEFTNDYDLRLRHAAAEWGPWKLGQFWSGFVDVFSFPETADPGGPLAAPVLRNPGIYYVKGERETSNWGVGIENPAADLGGRTDLIASEELPNLVAFTKIQRDWGYIRLAALGLQLESDEDSEYTGGIHLSGRINTPFTGSKNNVSFATQYGKGFVHYFSSFVGELDGVISDSGDIEATEIFGAFLGYQHFWSGKWRSTFTASTFDLSLPSGAEPLSYSDGERYSANLFFTANENVTFGLEGIYNTIETFNESAGDGVRIEFVGRYDF